MKSHHVDLRGPHLHRVDLRGPHLHRVDLRGLTPFKIPNVKQRRPNIFMITAVTNVFDGENEILNCEMKFSQVFDQEFVPQDCPWAFLCRDNEVYPRNELSSDIMIRSMAPFSLNVSVVLYRSFEHQGSLLGLARELLELDDKSHEVTFLWTRRFDCNLRGAVPKRLVKSKKFDDLLKLLYVMIALASCDSKYQLSVGLSRWDMTYWTDKAILALYQNRIEKVPGQNNELRQAAVEVDESTPGNITASLYLDVGGRSRLCEIIKDVEAAVFPEAYHRSCEELYIRVSGSLLNLKNDPEKYAKVIKLISDYDGAWSHWQLQKFLVMEDELFANRDRIVGTVLMENGLEIPVWRGKILGREVEIFRQVHAGQYRLGFRTRAKKENANVILNEIKRLVGVNFEVFV